MKQPEEVPPPHIASLCVFRPEHRFRRHGPRPAGCPTQVVALVALFCAAGHAGQAAQLPDPPAPIINPNGGAFDQPKVVTITQPPMSVLTNTPDWRIGTKHPTEKIEEGAALSNDGETVMAIRARTNTDNMGKFPCVNLSPDHGNIPFYIWSLEDLAGGYQPSLFAGVTESVDWDGANRDFYFGETGNRVFLLLRQWKNKDGDGGGISLWSCANGRPQEIETQKLAEFDRRPMNIFAKQPVRLEFYGKKVRVRVGESPLMCPTTDADGWVTYTGDDASGRVPAALGPTRFWISLAGGEFKGARELVLSDSPPPNVRFTCDGSEVTADSPVLSRPLTVTHNVEIRASSFYANHRRSKETVATFLSKLPLLPTESYVSPIYLTIPHAPLDGTPAQVSIDGPNGTVEGLALGNLRYRLLCPLNPNKSTPLVLHRNGIKALKEKVVWRPFAITTKAENTRLTIRRGETLLLTAKASRQSLLRIEVVDGAGQPYRSFTGTGGDLFPSLFDRAGAFRANATLDDIPAGVVDITVTPVDFKGPIACQVGHQREKEVAVYGSMDGVFFTSSAPKIMRVSVGEPTTEGVRLKLEALQYGKPALQVRLGSPTGPVFGEQPVDLFTLELAGSCRVGNGNEPTGVPMAMHMRPYLGNLRIDVSMEATFSTFDGNARSFSVNTSDTTASTNLPGFRSEVDKATGEKIGIVDFTIEIPETEDGWAFGSGVSVTECDFPYTRVGGL